MTNLTLPKLRGILVAVTTPFIPDGTAVDEPVLRAQVDRLIAAGVHGLVPTGSTGEFTTLSPAEYRRVIELHVQAAAGRVPVVPGIGALSTTEAISLAQHAERVGADAVMVVPPFYGGLPWGSLVAFLRAVTEAITIPIMYYNIPAATGVRLGADELAALGRIDGIAWLKDTSGDAVTLTDLLVNRADSIKAFNGWDTLTFMGLCLGAEASVWGAAGIVPELAVALWEAVAEQGDLARGRAIWKHLWAISDFLESVEYAPGVKVGCELVGFPVGPARAPAQPVSTADRARFAEILRDAEAFRVAEGIGTASGVAVQA